MVTAVTEAREMVSGSIAPAIRLAFLSMSSMSRIAGSSGQQYHNGNINRIIKECILGRTTSVTTTEDTEVMSSLPSVNFRWGLYSTIHYITLWVSKLISVIFLFYVFKEDLLCSFSASYMYSEFLLGHVYIL